MQIDTASSTVLVVGNDDGARSARVLVLRQASLRTMEACDGPAALDAARRERPDLIICDAIAPAMNGRALWAGRPP